MKIKAKKVKSPAVKIFASLPPPLAKKNKETGFFMEPVIRRMRGNPYAKILLIAPPCTAYEYDEGVPLCGDEARVFHTILSEDADIDTEKDCLVLPSAQWGIYAEGKTKKAHTEAARQFLEKSLALNQFELYIIVGTEAFKHIFGRGKKPSMNSIAGNVMYVKETKFKPVFVFPDLDGLHYVQDTPRPDYRRRDWNQKVTLRFEKCARILKQLVSKLKLP